jgi:MoaA/NifB/PqqE/SkfB family radical SAM enzyme
MTEKIGNGYFSRAVNNQWVTLGRLMIGRAAPSTLNGMRISPVYSSVMVTQNCNYKCVMCSFWHRHTENELSAEEVTEATAAMRRIGISQVNFTGGEPFLRSDLGAIVRATTAQGFTMVQVTTNGSLATRARLEELLAGGLGRIAISMDGVGAHHEMQRGVPGAWRKNIAALDALRELRGRFPKLEIELAMVISKITMGDLAEVLRLCEEYRAVLHLQFLDNVQFFTSEVDVGEHALSPNDIDRLVDEVHRHLERSPGIDPLLTHQGIEYVRRYLKRQDPTESMPAVSCGVGYAMLYIDSVGKVYPGCWAMAPIGDIREQALEAIVDSARHRAVALDQLQMNCPHCPNGYTWGVFTNPRSLVRELRDRAAHKINAARGAP